MSSWYDFFVLFKDNLCDNALNLTTLIIENNWPDGTYCKWIISTQEDDAYVTLEFQNLNVNLKR